MMKHDRLCVLLVFLTLLMLVSRVRAQTTSGSDWPMLGHDAAHTSATSSDIEPPLVKKSIFNITTGQSVASPIVSGDSIFAFVQHASVQVYSVDRGTGVVKWTYDTGGSLFAWPAAGDGFIFVPVTYRGPPPVPNGTRQNIQATGGGALLCLDELNGRLVWSRNTVTTIMTSPIVEDGTVYATFDREGAYALDAATGNVKWFYPIDPSVMIASPIEYNGTVIAPIYARGVVALDAQNGGLKWKYDVASHFKFHPGAVGESTVGAGMVFAPFYDFSDDNRSRYRVTLVAFNRDDGEVVWQTLLLDFASEGGFAGNTYLAFANDTVYAVGPYHYLNGTIPGTGPVIALDATTGEVKWSTSVARPFWRVVVAGESLIVLSDVSPTYLAGSKCPGNCTIQEINAIGLSTGATMWSYHIDTEFDPVVADGVLYLVTDPYSTLSSLSSTTAVPEIHAPATILLTSFITLVAFRTYRKHQVQKPLM
jgi:outer membrane protein assembly factor BamB